MYLMFIEGESEMNICVTVNSKYMRYLYVMLQSLYENNKKGSIDLYVLQRDFTDFDKKEISYITSQFENRVHFIWVDEHKFDDMPRYTGGRSNLSLEIYFRLLIPEFLPDTLERILMLDVDIVVNKDISELYNIDFQGKMLAAAPNMCHNFEVRKDWRKWYPAGRTNWTHYNTGILMWNLAGIRKAYPEEYIFRQVWKQKIETATFEEELFNVEFGEDLIQEIPAEKWNYIVTHMNFFYNPKFEKYNSVEDVKRECSIVHYAAMNPWQDGTKSDMFRIWWEYARKTPYYTEILEESYIKAERLAAKQEKILKYIDLMLNEYTAKKIIDNLEERKSHRIMIYGAGRVARCLNTILKESDIEVVGYIDKSYRGKFCGMYPVGLEAVKNFENEIDLIIVSLGYYYDAIKPELESYTKCKIVSIDEIIK